MGTPTDDFANLTLVSPTGATFAPSVAGQRPTESQEMPHTGAEIERRAPEVRDILSSFDVNILPQEFLPDVFDAISYDQYHRPPHEWTIPGDFLGTMFRWGVYREDLHRVLRDIQSPDDRERLFRQKARRRFDAEFEAYDTLVGSASPTLSARDRRGKLLEIHKGVPVVVKSIADLARTIGTDEHQLNLNEVGVARILLDALRQICERDVDPAPHGIARTRTSRSLFKELLVRQLSNGTRELFMLNELEDVSDATLAVLHTELRSIARRLADLNADPEYQVEFGELVRRSL